MKKILIFLLIPLSSVGQNTIGLPDLINYPNQTYSAGLQNWGIRQDKQGNVHFANNEGLLSFNGIQWTLNRLPNKTILRSLEISPEGRIYAGGQDEFGYYFPGKIGNLQYHSLVELLPARYRSFGDVWDIVCMKKDVFFRSGSRIFKLCENNLLPYPAKNEWLFMEQCAGRLYAQDRQLGLMIYDNGYWIPLEHASALLHTTITGIIDVGNGALFVTTLKNGIYRLENGSCSKLSSKNNDNFERDRIYAAVGLTEELTALGSSTNGVYIINRSGDIVQRFSQKEGLQNDNVLCLFKDLQGNLWLGLDNGIDLITYNSAIKKVNPRAQAASGYAAALYNHKLYIGTSNGLYSVTVPDKFNDLSFILGEFTEVMNTKGQVWNLTTLNKQLLMGHHEGAFKIDGNNAVLLTTVPGIWNFIPMGSVMPTEKILAGHYNGIQELGYSGNTLTPLGDVPEFRESSRYIATDRNNDIWISHPYHGIFSINGIASGKPVITTYTEKQGLPGLLNNHVYRIRNTILAATEKGVYGYNENNKRFEPAEEYRRFFGDRGVRYLREDSEGNIWYIRDKKVGVLDYSGKECRDIEIPELNRKMLSGFELIYPVDNRNILLGGEKGFYLINYEKYKESQTRLQVQISKITVSAEKDSVLYSGYYPQTRDGEKNPIPFAPELGSSLKNINFSFSAPLFGNQAAVEYTYRLQGYDREWSKWNSGTFKEYTNLPAGNYVFEVKARYRSDSESNTASFSFTLLPPWYQTLWARALFLLLLGCMGFMVYRMQKNKFSRQQLLHEQEQQQLRYIHELERNKAEGEIVALSKEKLEAEINHKNSELASSAMHLVKKGELLGKIKAELSKIIKSIENPQAIAELKKLMKSVSEDDNFDKEWDNFSKHFDKVQSDFLIALREQHPAITANELKLSAYLRMNLSTKEISQLMNISVRGVEISRYRLRKKLGLVTETSLFDYLAGIQKKPDDHGINR